MTTRSQTEEEAQKVNTGALKDKNGLPYTKENYPFIFFNKPYNPSISIMKWKTCGSWKYQEYDHEETDYTRYEADDGTYIKAGKCRSCKESIKPYKETFYLKEFEYNTWNNTAYNQQSGYCKECALKKAVVIDKGWCDYLEQVDSETLMVEGEYVTRRVYADGSEIEDMTMSEFSKSIQGCR